MSRGVQNLFSLWRATNSFMGLPGTHIGDICLLSQKSWCDMSLQWMACLNWEGIFRLAVLLSCTGPKDLKGLRKREHFSNCGAVDLINAILLPELVLIYSIYLLTMGPKVVALIPEIGSQSSQYRWDCIPKLGTVSFLWHRMATMRNSIHS